MMGSRAPWARKGVGGEGYCGYRKAVTPASSRGLLGAYYTPGVSHTLAHWLLILALREVVILLLLFYYHFI